MVDNSYTSATGGQDILSTALNPTRSTGHEIEKAVKGVGVNWVKTIKHTYDLKTMTNTLREALTTDEQGPKVLIAQSECMLNKQRREKKKCVVMLPQANEWYVSVLVSTLIPVPGITLVFVYLVARLYQLNQAKTH